MAGAGPPAGRAGPGLGVVPLLSLGDIAVLSSL